MAMFKTKNLSPVNLSLFTALVLSIPVSMAFYVVSKNVYAGIIALVITLLGNYLLIRFVLESFIYRKIKLIYKFIYQTKASKKEEMYYKYILPNKSIDEVREDVEEWAQQKKTDRNVAQQ
jgi:two-component system phosphate regulon sensor histidine kinase PhoR